MPLSKNEMAEGCIRQYLIAILSTIPDLTYRLGLIFAVAGLGVLCTPVLLHSQSPEAAPLSITTASLPNATLNIPYRAPLAAIGGATPYTWSVGQLPTGLSVEPSTGAISGTPTGIGGGVLNSPTVQVATLTLQVSDSNRQTATKVLGLTIILPTLTITTTSLPNGKVGSAYSATLAATGGVSVDGYTWSVLSGSLPTGLSLASSRGSCYPCSSSDDTGVISGPPTSSGTSSFTVQVTDFAGQTAQKSLTLTIAPGSLSVTTTSLPSGTQGSAYNATLAATGGTTPYTWLVFSGSLPSGLSLGATSGLISGTPTKMGTGTFTVQVSDSNRQTATKVLTLTINPISITTTSLPSGTEGSAYSATLIAVGGTTPYTWLVFSGSLPSGLSLGSTSGVISGNPIVAETADFSVQVSDSGSLKTIEALTLRINAPPGMPSLSDSGIVNNASYAPGSTALAPGTIAAIFGTHLTDGTSCVHASGCDPHFDGNGRLGTAMSGAQVMINGNPVPIYYTTPTQLGVQIPTDLIATSATVELAVNGLGRSRQSILVAPFAPGIFTQNQRGTGPAAITHADVAGTLVDSAHPAHPGETLVIYATGLGQALPSVPTGALPTGTASTITKPSVTIDGLPAQVLFSGLSGCCVGLNQVSIAVPSKVHSGEVNVVLSIGGNSSNTVTISTVLLPSPPPVITSATSASGTVGTAFSYQITATNSPVSFGVTGLSPGLSLNTGTGVISGTPTSAGTFSIRLSATNVGGTGTATLTITINDPVTINPPPPPVNPLTIFAATGDVFKSTNGGANWVRASSGILDGGASVVAIDPFDANTVYAGGSEWTPSVADMCAKLYKSTNGGATWNPTSLTSVIPCSPLTVSMLLIDPSNSRVLYAGTLGGVFKSTDGGSTWTDVSPRSFGILGVVIPPILGLAIDPKHPSTLYVASTMGVLKSINAAASWAAANNGLTGVFGISAVAIDPVSSEMVYAATLEPTSPVSSVEPTGIFKSTNSGASWTRISHLSSGDRNPVESFAIDQSNPATIYAATIKAIYKSIDNGGSWSELKTAPPASVTGVHSLVINPRNPAMVYAGTTGYPGSGGVLQTTDGGASWMVVSSGASRRNGRAESCYCPRQPVNITGTRAFPSYPYAMAEATLAAETLFAILNSARLPPARKGSQKTSLLTLAQTIHNNQNFITTPTNKKYIIFALALYIPQNLVGEFCNCF